MCRDVLGIEGIERGVLGDLRALAQGLHDAVRHGRPRAQGARRRGTDRRSGIRQRRDQPAVDRGRRVQRPQGEQRRFADRRIAGLERRLDRDDRRAAPEARDPVEAGDPPGDIVGGDEPFQDRDAVVMAARVAPRDRKLHLDTRVGVGREAPGERVVEPGRTRPAVERGRGADGPCAHLRVGVGDRRGHGWQRLGRARRSERIEGRQPDGPVGVAEHRDQIARDVARPDPTQELDREPPLARPLGLERGAQVRHHSGTPGQGRESRAALQHLLGEASAKRRHEARGIATPDHPDHGQACQGCDDADREQLLVGERGRDDRNTPAITVPT